MKCPFCKGATYVAEVTLPKGMQPEDGTSILFNKFDGQANVTKITCHDCGATGSPSEFKQKARDFQALPPGDR